MLDLLEREVRPNLDFTSTARGSVADRQLLVEVMSPVSRYRTDIVTSIDALEMLAVSCNGDNSMQQKRHACFCPSFLDFPF
jgi:hypothetical protein